MSDGEFEDNLPLNPREVLRNKRAVVILDDTLEGRPGNAESEDDQTLDVAQREVTAISKSDDGQVIGRHARGSALSARLRMLETSMKLDDTEDGYLAS